MEWIESNHGPVIVCNAAKRLQFDWKCAIYWSALLMSCNIWDLRFSQLQVSRRDSVYFGRYVPTCLTSILFPVFVLKSWQQVSLFP
jgi:hypothetical protein